MSDKTKVGKDGKPHLYRNQIIMSTVCPTCAAQPGIRCVRDEQTVAVHKLRVENAELIWRVVTYPDFADDLYIQVRRDVLVAVPNRKK